MEDLLSLFAKADGYCNELDEWCEHNQVKLRAILYDNAALPSAVTALITEPPAASPQQLKKRAKRLSSLPENDGDSSDQRKSTRTSNSRLLSAVAETEDASVAPQPSVAASPAPNLQPPDEPTEPAVQTQQMLMPPPAAPAPAPIPTATVPATASQSSASESESGRAEQSFARPQRAAKLKSEKNLKEPRLNQKMRRPSNLDSTKIKLEHEHRVSQMHVEPVRQSSKSSIVSSASEDTLVILPEKTPSLVDLATDDDNDADADQPTENKENEKNKPNAINISMEKTGRQLRVKIKREKVSLSSEAVVDESTISMPPTVPMPRNLPTKTEHMSDESTLASTTLSMTTRSTTTIAAATAPQGKRGRTKKAMPCPKPIKVERFSDALQVSGSPVASRTRHGSIGRVQTSDPRPRSPSIYEDAVDKAPTQAEPPAAAMPASAAVNETVTLGGAQLTDATFSANAAHQATFQVAPAQTTFIMAANTDGKKSASADVADATFNVGANAAANATAGREDDEQQQQQQQQQQSFLTAQHSMETVQANDEHDHNNEDDDGARTGEAVNGEDSLITEDDDDAYEPATEKERVTRNTQKPAKQSAARAVGIPRPAPASAKLYKMPSRTNELFNPLVQSPVKKKVEAFEKVASAADLVELTKSGRPKRTKDGGAATATATQSSSLLTPHFGKLHAPTLGRFLTPTQASNITPNPLAKKAPNSASKAMTYPRLNTASNLKTTNATSTKTLSRENSADDMRKGLTQMTEERKRQREQKHLLAAQQREAKERERAERLAKLAKEREEKRQKKQQEAEQKKRELEEIQRKLRQPDDSAEAARKAAAAAAKNKAIMDQERELLQQMKVPTGGAKSKMLPPPVPAPRLQTDYNFEMLHEDDSTDDETKTSYKRPPPPTWSRSHVRGAAIQMQQYWPTNIIDSFFSVQPTTPDLREIFPDIKESHLKRNSSVLWSTPPRYSELPKY